MKYSTLIFILLVLILFAVPVVFAEDVETSRGLYTTPYAPLTDWLNNNEPFKHVHQSSLPEKGIDKVVGVNAKVVDFKKIWDQTVLDSLKTEYRFSIRDKSHTVGAFIELDLTFWQN